MSLRSIRLRTRLGLSDKTTRDAAREPCSGRLFLRKDWLQVTDCLSQEGRRALYLLVRAAAQLGRKEIPIDIDGLAMHAKGDDGGSTFRSCLAELRRHQLVREVRPGVFAIADGLWQVGSVGDAAFFAAPD
jgi:hypothetical protein